MRIGIATDHGGYGLKEEFVGELKAAGHEVVDFGAHQLLDQLLIVRLAIPTSSSRLPKPLPPEK